MKNSSKNQVKHQVKHIIPEFFDNYSYIDLNVKLYKGAINKRYNISLEMQLFAFFNYRCYDDSQAFKLIILIKMSFHILLLMRLKHI